MSKLSLSKAAIDCLHSLLYRRAFVQTQKESIPDRASVYAKKDDFGTKK